MIHIDNKEISNELLEKIENENKYLILKEIDQKSKEVFEKIKDSNVVNKLNILKDNAIGIK
jgi:hypothetical protein